MNRITDTVKHLIIINGIFFIAANFLFPWMYDSFALYSFGNPNFHEYQFATHMFMHAKFEDSLMHIVFNMFALYSFGSNLEHFWGSKRFLFFYLVCGLGAGLINNLVNYYFFESGLTTLLENGFNKTEIITILNQGGYDTRWTEFLGQSSLDNFISGYSSKAVGASGAIYGLLVASAMMFPDSEIYLYFIPVPLKAKYFIPGMICVDLFLGLKGQSIFGYGGTGIAHFAHLGGALFGFILMMIWRNNKFNHTRWN